MFVYFGSMNQNPNHTMSVSEMKKLEKKRQAAFEDALNMYLVSCNPISLSKTPNEKPEFEIRFGINKTQSKPISKIDYDNVVHQLMAHGWTSDNLNGSQMLRINTEEYIQEKQPGDIEGTNIGDIFNGGVPPKHKSKIRMSSTRLEIVGSDLIEQYCHTNSFEKLKNMSSTTRNQMKFTQKKGVSIGMRQEDGYKPMTLDFKDFNFRASHQIEKDFQIYDSSKIPPYLQKMIHNWSSSRKNFRVINRVRFSHHDSPVFVDISIVKTNRIFTSRTGEKINIPAHTIQEANVFSNPENYEIELELNNDMIGANKLFNTTASLLQKTRESIRIVLSGLQETPYPISYQEQEDVLHDYMRSIHGEEWKPFSREQPIIFLGPSSKTLQIENVVPSIDLKSGEKSNPSIPHIDTNYTVTEKADGERALLFIPDAKRKTPEGYNKIYMITPNLKVIFTGAVTKESKCFGSILDGEYIAYGKKPSHTFLHLYAAFDIYYIGAREKNPSVRELSFCTNDQEAIESNYRLPLLKQFISILKPEHIGKDKSDSQMCVFQIMCKRFEWTTPDQTIFEGCKNILQKTKEGGFPYEIDGLIFTPMNTGVGGERPGEASDKKKITWKMSFKWKPPEFNTIDFLVSVKKDEKDRSRDDVSYTFLENSSIIQYKTLELRCGFDKYRHKYMNPFNDMISDNLDSTVDETRADDDTGLGPAGFKNYVPMAFQPSSPYDADAHLCFIALEKNATNGRMYMKTEDGQVFEEDMVVEFRYARDDDSKKGPWKWVPIRVRYDKTSELRAGGNSFGNDFTTADNNWHSIHYPVTENMIMGKVTPGAEDIDDTIYYNRIEKDAKSTMALRNFHNLYVKNRLISGVATHLRENMHLDSPLLIDYAVGKAGDLNKWLHSRIKFVLGIDVSEDNIMNTTDGACARYLNARKKDRQNKLRALFVHGNTGMNIRSSGKAFYTNQEKELVDIAFGQSNQKTNYKFNGIARDGFHISSCQFAMHYFFENKTTLHNFLRNLQECTRKDGYFVGTCYDGGKVFQALKTKQDGESMRLENEKGEKIFEITKKYGNDARFTPYENSLGMAIRVYQESIDKEFVEYLVNFEYFIEMMHKYGFDLLRKEEYMHMGFQESTGYFQNLYKEMKQEIKRTGATNYGVADQMTPNEQKISFLNRYFIFKKVREISQAQIKLLMDGVLETPLIEEKMIVEEKEILLEEGVEEKKEGSEKKEKEEPKKKPRARKTMKKKVVIEENSSSASK